MFIIVMWRRDFKFEVDESWIVSFKLFLNVRLVFCFKVGVIVCVVFVKILFVYKLKNLL